MRALLLLLLLVQCARSAYVAVSAVDGELVELDAAAYFSFASHQEDYLPFYLPATHSCQYIIDAQLVQTDATYRIDDWYYMPAGNTGTSVRVSITDLRAFLEHAFDIGVWAGEYDCDTVWTRLSASTLRDVCSSITWPVGSPLATSNYGVQCAFYCEDSVCTAQQLTAVLKVAPSNGVLDMK